MVSTDQRSRRTVTTSEGMEVDLSAAGLQRLPESLGIEVTPGELRPTLAPQTTEIPEKEIAHQSTRTAQLRLASSPTRKDSFGSRSLWKSKCFLLLLAAVIIVGGIMVVLAIPLALRLKKTTNSSSPISPNSTTRVPNTLPTSGALNGTGLALIALGLTDVPDVSLFYQDYNLRIRRLHSIALSPFYDGFPVVASNARNATPLTTLIFPTTSGEMMSHLFYIDINNTLQSLYSPDNFTTWQSSTLGSYNFTASPSSTALTAFYSHQWLGQDGNSSGVRLYYGGPDDQVHELALFPDVDAQWFSQSILQGTNGNAGIASGWWDGPGFGNLYLFGKNNEFQIWSNNFNATRTTTEKASYGDWVNDPSQSYYPVNANTALSFNEDTLGFHNRILCFRETSNETLCSSISSSNGSLLAPSEAHPVTDSQQNPPQQGSALLAWWKPNVGTYALELDLFYQAESGDIIQDFDTGTTWVNSTLPAR